MPVPVIDLFAGPGGLGEGFSSLHGHDRQPFFEIGLSIEKDPVAHRTLTLRAVFRRLRGTCDVRHYYSYLRGEIDEATFRAIPAVASAFEHATREARCLELGKAEPADIDREIRTALKGRETWVLIGGPPCQAYSLAGRARGGSPHPSKLAVRRHALPHDSDRRMARIRSRNNGQRQVRDD